MPRSAATSEINTSDYDTAKLLEPNLLKRSVVTISTQTNLSKFNEACLKEDEVRMVLRIIHVKSKFNEQRSYSIKTF